MINNLNKKPYLVAEIGWNFLGNLTLAKKMILSAKKSGADAVKFQVWDPKYLTPGAWDKDGRREIYNKSYLNKKKYLILKKYSKKIKIDSFVSIFSTKQISLLKQCNDNIVKIPSHEAYNLKLIKECIKKFKLVIISAGALKKSELDKLSRFNKNKVMILHCVSSYPLKQENCNFFKFDYLKKKFKNVGYSGHYYGLEDAIHAISKGACLIEKHFTTSNSLKGRDNKFAIKSNEMKKLREWIDITSNMNKNNGIGLQECEKDIYLNYRGRWSHSE